jgi:L-tyrosine isonitrile synthase
MYYQINMVEKRAVEMAFPHSIFITFNGSRLRVLFPKRLPIFYMYSLRRGFSVKPWFVVSDSER